MNHRYKVLDNGDIVSNYRGKNRTLKTADNGDGYKFVTLSLLKNKTTIFYVHRLVATKHIPNPEGKPEVNHIDGDKSNNHKDNLEWATRPENMKHAYSIGLLKSKRKLTDDEVIEIKNRYVKSCRNNGQSALGKEFGVDQKTINSIINNKLYKEI